MTISLKINKNSKEGKAFLKLAKNSLSDHHEVNIVSSELDDDESPYNPEFVKMVLDAAKSKNRTTIDPKDIWGSLGLK